MQAINNLMEYVSDSDLLIECDSDDYFCDNAVEIISQMYSLIEEKNIYALCFLKSDESFNILGNKFKTNNYESNMFNLYFKEGITGDKALVFITNIRKQFKYQLQDNEKFITEATLYNEMDKQFNILCFNESIMICEYLTNGYSQNIKKLFLQNPLGYYIYFKQLINFNMKNVSFSKRLYIIKHYILFNHLAKQKKPLLHINGPLNKLLFIVLYIPGIIKSKKYARS